MKPHRLRGLACAAALLWAPGSQAQNFTKVYPLIGDYQKYTVQKGDTLYGIARRFDVGAENLRRLNGLQNNRVKPGMKLLLPTLHVLPRLPEDGIVLNIPEKRLYLVRNGQAVARHAVAIGSVNGKTPTGEYQVARLTKNPTWVPPQSATEGENAPDGPVPPGPNNPLGDRWIGWSRWGFGFHGTNQPRSIGRAASLGCVRLYPDQIRSLFENVEIGMPIVSVYEPIKIGKKAGRYFLSVTPDPYNTGQAALSRVRTKLEKVGLLRFVDEATVRQITAAKHAYPRAIFGRPERLKVNGSELEIEIAPALVNGTWVAPVRQVVSALGGTVRPGPEPNSYSVQLAQGELLLRAGSNQALLNGQSLQLPVTVGSIEGRLVAPLSVLSKAAGGHIDWAKNDAINVIAGTASR